MFFTIISFILITSVNPQRYTHPFFQNHPNYEVNEGPKSIFQSGDNLRFGLNPKLGDPNGFLNGNHFKSIFEDFNQNNFFNPKLTPFGGLNNFPSHFHNRHQQPLIYKEKGFDENKKLADSSFKREQGQQGVEGEAGIKKVNEDVESKKEAEKNSAAFAAQEGVKKVVEDSKEYDGKKMHEKEGSNENEEKNKSSHKKGHVIKHFKNSHHKDETGRDEQYYDEEHDEGGSFKYDSSKGKFGENESSQHKELQENKELASSEKEQKAGHENSEFSGRNSGHSEQFKEEKKLSDAAEHGNGNLHNEESILNHQEAEKVLLKQPLHDGFDKDT
nr:uncharacterized protein LOC111428370 [Onthophagus taurus]